MAKTKAVKLAHTKGGIFSSSGYQGVTRKGSTFSWRYEGVGGVFGKGGYETAEEAAYDYDEFLIAKMGPDNAITNQVLGLLKPKTVLAVREKISSKERPIRKANVKNKTGFKGVVQNKNKYAKRFSANCCVKGKVVYIGSYETPQAAARAYDDFARKHIGRDAKTNESLGLIPPRTEEELAQFQAQNSATTKPNSSPLSPVQSGTTSGLPEDDDDYDDEPQPASLLHGSGGYLSPEDERLKQIEAARTMAQAEDIEEEEEEEHPAVTAQPKANETAPPGEPVILTPAPPLSSVPVGTGLSGELILAANSTAEDMRRQAEALLRAAADADNKQLKNEMLNIIETISHEVEGYQKELMRMIDHGAEIEQAISRLKNMLLISP